MKRETSVNKRKQNIIAGVVIVIIALIIDLSPLGGNIRFYSKWAECGVKPVQIQSKPGIAWYEESPVFMPIMRNQSWYCTPIEAERAGYSASENTYTYPNIKKAGETSSVQEN